MSQKRIGVLPGPGHEGLIHFLNDAPIEYAVEDIPWRKVVECSLEDYFLLVIPGARSARGVPVGLRAALRSYVREGGNMLLTHDAVGGRDMFPIRLFPEVASGKAMVGWRQPESVNRVTPTDGGRRFLDHDAQAPLRHPTWDHFTLHVQDGAETLFEDAPGEPVMACGRFGKGRVMVCGFALAFDSVVCPGKPDGPYAQFFDGQEIGGIVVIPRITEPWIEPLILNLIPWFDTPERDEAAAPPPDDLSSRIVSAVSRFYDHALCYAQWIHPGPDNKGIPLLADAIDVNPETGPQPLQGPDGLLMCNPATHGTLYRTLRTLTRLTGNEEYQNAGNQEMRFFLRFYQNPETGLLPWGGHLSVNLASGDVFDCTGRNSPSSHELKAHYLDFEAMEDADPERTRRYVDAVWEHQVLNDETLLFTRHASLLGLFHPPPSGQHPMSTDGCQFMSTGQDLCLAALYLHEKTGDPEWLSRAQRLSARYDAARNPDTGLTGNSHGMASRPRVLQACDMNRYTYEAALNFLLFEELGEAGRVFADCSLHDLQAFARHMYEEDGRGFFFRRWIATGERIRPETKPIEEISTYRDLGQLADFKNRFLPLLFYASAMGYRLTQDAQLRGFVERLIQALDLPNDLDLVVATSEHAAFLIQGLLELDQATEQQGYLDLAKRIAEYALDAFVTDDGYFIDWPESNMSRLTNRLPLALLRLYGVLERRSELVEPDPAGGNYCQAGHPVLRRQYEQHVHRLRRGALTARVSDSFPGPNKGALARTGVAELRRETDPHNLFDPEQRGLVFEPMKGVMAMNVVRLGRYGVGMAEGFNAGDQDPLRFFARVTYELLDQGIDFHAELLHVPMSAAPPEDSDTPGEELRLCCRSALAEPFNILRHGEDFAELKTALGSVLLIYRADTGAVAFEHEDPAAAVCVWRFGSRDLPRLVRIWIRLILCNRTPNVEDEIAELRRHADEDLILFDNPTIKTYPMGINMG